MFALYQKVFSTDVREKKRSNRKTAKNNSIIKLGQKRAINVAFSFTHGRMNNAYPVTGTEPQIVTSL